MIVIGKITDLVDAEQMGTGVGGDLAAAALGRITLDIIEELLRSEEEGALTLADFQDEQ